jgi:hypothetical protein
LERRSAFKIVTGTPKGKRLLEGLGINARNWTDSAQDRNYWRALINALLNLLYWLAISLLLIKCDVSKS